MPSDCINAGTFHAEDPMHIAGVLWAATHGAVSLELAGHEGAVDAEHRSTTYAPQQPPGS